MPRSSNGAAIVQTLLAAQVVTRNEGAIDNRRAASAPRAPLPATAPAVQAAPKRS